MPRLFVALPVPEEVGDALAGLQGGVPQARWVPQDDFHVTLCFCGEVDGGRMRDLEEELGDIALPPFEVALAGVDAFVEGGSPRALYAAVARCESLDRLHAKVSAVARGSGIAVDRRKFRPHVTLARFPARAEAGHHLAQFVAGAALFRAGPWIADSFVLYSSRTRPDGAVYVAEAEYPLRF